MHCCLLISKKIDISKVVLEYVCNLDGTKCCCICNLDIDESVLSAAASAISPSGFCEVREPTWLRLVYRWRHCDHIYWLFISHPSPFHLCYRC